MAAIDIYVESFPRRHIHKGIENSKYITKYNLESLEVCCRYELREEMESISWRRQSPKLTKILDGGFIDRLISTKATLDLIICF